MKATTSRSKGNAVSRDTLDLMIEENMGLVVSLAKSFKPRDNDELDEFIQLGRIAVWKAIENHDPSRSSLSTTMWYYIRWEILRILTKREKKPEIQLDNELPIEHNGFIGENIWEYFPSSLSPQEKQIIELRMDGHSFIEIGKRLGFSRGWANNKFRESLEKIYEANR